MATVSYAKVFNLGNYENERIFLEDEVREGEGETLEEAYQRVRGWVEARHNENRIIRSHEQKLNVLRRKIVSLNHHRDEVVTRWREAVSGHNQLRDILVAHGVDFPALPFYMLPPEDQGDYVADPGAPCPRCECSMQEVMDAEYCPNCDEYFYEWEPIPLDAS